MAAIRHPAAAPIPSPLVPKRPSTRVLRDPPVPVRVPHRFGSGSATRLTASISASFSVPITQSTEP